MFHSKFLDTTEAQSMKKTFDKADFTKMKIKTTLQRTMSRKWKNKLQTERKYRQKMMVSTLPKYTKNS